MTDLVRERYEVLETLGTGGEGRVVKALDHQHGRLVALKIISVGKAADRDDLLAEARILLGLAPHPALPLVREDFFEGDQYVIAMDWVDGTDLARLLRTGGQPGLAPSSVLAYLADAADALTYLHTQAPPVIHGDVKPANLILTRGGRVKLVDFGMSSVPGSFRRRAGTPGFHAPELSAGSAPSRAADVYALAATAFTLLTGSVPSGVLPQWQGMDPDQAIRLEKAIRLGLATDPARRPRTPGEFVERLCAGWAVSLPTGVMTFCLTDIVGSTALWEEHPDAMASALVRHDDLIAQAIEACGGRFLRSMGEGDSTFAVFDTATRALDAVIAAAEALTREEWPNDLNLKVRFGLHTGEAERHGTTYVGPDVNLAARLRGQADGGQIFLSSVTAELVSASLPEGYRLVDLGPHHLRGVRAPERVFALVGPNVPAPLPATECPYRGLQAFEASDRRFFFGRESIVAELTTRIAPGQLLALVGASGSGKSSVLRAGVVARVRAGEVSGCTDAVLTTPGVDLSHPRCPETVLLVVDQFEEVFTMCDDADRRRAYVDAVLKHVGPVVIGLRADFYGRLSAYPMLAAAVVDNQILLGPLTEQELRSTIVEPARLAGLKLEPGLVDLVVRDVAGEPGSLPLLSHALRATWEQRDGRTLTVDGYRESGGVHTAIARTADRVLEATPPARRPLFRNVLLRLTELGDGIEETRRRVDVEDLRTERSSQQDLDAVLSELTDARLVTLDAGTVEVAHEALIREWPTLRSWLEEDRAGLRLHRALGEAARLWDAAGQEHSDLYRGTRLDAAQEWVDAHPADLNTVELAFLDASMRQRQAEVDDLEARAVAQTRANRRLRLLLSAVVVALVIALVAGLLAVTQRNNASHERDRARNAARASALRALVESASSQRSTKRDLAALLALAAYRIAPGPGTEGALLRTFTGSSGYEGSVAIPGRQAVGGALLPDGRTYAAVDVTGGVRLVDLITGESKASLPSLHTKDDGDVRVDLSPDGRYLALGSYGPTEPNLLTNWDLRTRTRRFPDVRLDFNVGTVAFSPDGTMLAVSGGSPPHVEVRSAVDGSLIALVASLPPPPDAHFHVYTAAVRFLPDGMLAVGSQTGIVRLVDPRSGQELQRLTGPVESSEIELEVTADGRMLVGDGYAGVQAWSMPSGARAWARPARGNCSQIAIATVIGAVLCARSDGRVQAIDLATGSLLSSRFDYQLGVVSAINVGDDGNLLVEVGGPRLARWRLDGSGPVTRRILSGRDLVPEEFMGRSLLVGEPNPVTGGPMNPIVVDARTGAVVDPLHGVELATATPQPGQLLALFSDGVGGVYDVPSHRRLPNSLTEAPFVPVFAGKSDRTLVISNGGDMQGIDMKRRRLVAPHWQQSLDIVGIRISPDGRRLVTLEGGKLQPRTAAGAPRGRPIDGVDAVVGDDVIVVTTVAGGLEVLDAATLQPVKPPLPSVTGLTDQVLMTHDGTRILVVGLDQTARLADMATRQYIGDAIALGETKSGPVALSADGHELAYSTGDGMLVWNIDPERMVKAACQVASRNLTREEWAANLGELGSYRRLCPDQPAA